MYGALSTSTSGLIAQRTRVDVASANLANVSSPVDPNGDLDDFRRRIPILAPVTSGGIGGAQRLDGVEVTKIALDQGPFRPLWDPDHPMAFKEDDPERGFEAGYVYYPNTDWPTEIMNANEAARVYEANIAAAEATKTMLAQALQLIA